MGKTNLTEAGLFAGIGGFQLAARLEGIKTKWVCEINPYKLQILKQNFADVKLYRNIYQLRNPERTDILTGGFPCQDLSISGAGIGIVGWRSRLWQEYFRIICEVRPRYIVIENSPQLANRGLEIVLYDLSKIGYDAQWQCVQAYDLGFPILRERLFIVAFPVQTGQNLNDGIFKSISEVFHQTELSRQTNVSMPLKRIDRHTDFSSVRIRTGFSKQLDKNRIEAIGDAVNVAVAQYVLRCIKIFDKTLTNQ